MDISFHRRWKSSLAAALVTVPLIISTMQAQQFSAEVLVNGLQVKRQSIPATLYGANLEWVHSSWGAWDAGSGRLQPRADMLLRALSPAVLRFPGGVFADFYSWHNGVGPPLSRPTTPVTSGPDVSVHWFGTDEALSLAASVGARLLITVNVGTGTPEDAAAWVRHVNRTGTVVRDWELGNELYARTLSVDAARITMAPEVYAEKVIQFAAAMKAADPGIRIGAIGGLGSGILPVVEYPNWNQLVLQRAGSVIDFLSVHNAYSPVMYVDRGEDLETVYRAMLASPSLIRQDLQQLAGEIEQFAPDGAKSRIQIAVTEWAPMFHFSPLSRFVDHPKTLASALYASSVLMTMFEEPRVESAHYFKLFDNSFAGLIGRRNNDWQETAPFYALQLFRKHLGSRLVATTIVSPTFDSAMVGILPATAANSLVQAVASVTADGRAAYVTILNKHLSQAANVTLRLSGLRTGRLATLRRLQGTGVDSNTGTQLPYPEMIPWAPQAQASINPRFRSGAPGEVRITTSYLGAVGDSLAVQLPAASIVSIEIPLTSAVRISSMRMRALLKPLKIAPAPAS